MDNLNKLIFTVPLGWEYSAPKCHILFFLPSILVALMREPELHTQTLEIKMASRESPVYVNLSISTFYAFVPQIVFMITVYIRIITSTRFFSVNGAVWINCKEMYLASCFSHHKTSDTDKNLRIWVLMWMIKSFCSLTKRSEKGVILRERKRMKMN